MTPNKYFENINNKPWSKQKLNRLILNYLIIEGYDNSAIKFSQEIGLNLTNNDSDNQYSLLNGLQSIKQRNEIKLLLIKGEISTIIEKLNEYYPFLLENNDFLYFKILLLNLIEIIKNYQKNSKEEVSTKKDLKKKRRLSSISVNDKKKNRRKSSVNVKHTNKKELEFFDKIINFVKEKLFFKALKNKNFMYELELSMCLLLFDFKDFQNTENKHLPKDLLNLINNKNFKNEVFNLINNSILNYNTNYLGHSLKVNDDKGLLNNDFSNNEVKPKNQNVFYDSDSDIDSDEEADEYSCSQDLSIFDNDTDDDNNNDLVSNEEIIENHLNNNINSKFKQLINLWIWTENTASSENEEISKVNLDELFSNESE